MTDFATILEWFAPENIETEERICACGSTFTVDRLHGGHRKQCQQCSDEHNAAHVRNSYKKKGTKFIGNPVVVVGYVPIEGIPQEDYSDYYTGQEYPFIEVINMVKTGSFTPGIVLQRQGTPRVIVVGEDENQELRVI